MIKTYKEFIEISSCENKSEEMLKELVESLPIMHLAVRKLTIEKAVNKIINAEGMDEDSVDKVLEVINNPIALKIVNEIFGIIEEESQIVVNHTDEEFAEAYQEALKCPNGEVE